MSEYYVIYEEGQTSWGAYVPELPGCAAVGSTRAEVARLIKDAIKMHIAGMQEDGDPVPPPTLTTKATS
jgi:predicted RNase H-like HicB family nuclease